jgi:hypothetical protein
MSLTPEQSLEIDEVRYIGELGWFATLAVVVAAFSPYLAQYFS